MADYVLICRGEWDLTNPIMPVCKGALLSVQSGLAFDVSQLNPGDIMGALSSGFVVAAIPLSVIWGCRHVVAPLFRRL